MQKRRFVASGIGQNRRVRHLGERGRFFGVDLLRPTFEFGATGFWEREWRRLWEISVVGQDDNHVDEVSVQVDTIELLG